MIEDGRLLALLSAALCDAAREAGCRSESLVALSIGIRRRSNDLRALRDARS